MLVCLGIDVGGTLVKFATVDARGRVLGRGVLETPARSTPREALRAVAVAAQTLPGGRGVAAVGLACAGLVDRRGRLGPSPNLPGWAGTPLATVARRAFGVPVHVENDATAAAWGEYAVARRGRPAAMVLVTLGTGIGGGFVADGRLLRGATGWAGEFGHVTVDPRGPRCRCGNRGCLEAYAGGWALVRSARRRLRERRGRVLGRTVSAARIDPRAIADAARRGDALARGVLAEAADALGVACASLVNAFAPDRIVFGGGVSAAFDLLEPRVRAGIDRRAFAPAAARVKLERARMGNDAAVVGAAMLARPATRTP